MQAGVDHIILAVSYRAEQMEKELKSVEEKVKHYSFNWEMAVHGASSLELLLLIAGL